MSHDLEADICMIVHNDVRHDSRVLKEAGSLAKQGWKVVVLGISWKEKLPQVQEKDGFTIVLVAPKLFRGWFKGRLGLLLPLLPTLPTLTLRLRRIKARIYHAHDFTALFQIWLSGMWGRTIVYDSHELFFDRPLPDLPRFVEWFVKRLRPFETFMARRVRRVITVGDRIADQMAAAIGIPRPLVIRNAVDLRVLKHETVDYGMGQYRTIVHTGNLLPGRHFAELVTSLTHLPDDIVLVLMGGDGAETATVERLVKQYTLSARVHRVPPVAPLAVANTIQQADIAVILTMTEGLNNWFALPNKLFEAIAAGLPVVTGPNIEISDIVKRYNMGQICNPSDPASIAEAIETVLDPENYRTYKAGAERAREDINWRVEEEKLVALYNELLGQ